ncbi:conserved hypothetical protein [Ricinus communis]|uniref:TF-B3 domain-containing protein n=1 Tax=Ricinus communis TaxID=3988 RepID=B9STE5_RICCO|nr:conserved hypothetical protein [Ricinus communis]
MEKSCPEVHKRIERIPFDIPNATIIFSKPLKKTDKEHQLIVPTSVLQRYPIEGGYERDKPFLRPPKWHEFVEAHGLSNSDGQEYGVIFFVKNDSPNQLQVRGLRKNHQQFWGRIIWEEV